MISQCPGSQERKFQKEGMTNRATCSQEGEESKGWKEFPGDMVLLVAWERARPCAGGGKVLTAEWADERWRQWAWVQRVNLGA